MTDKTTARIIGVLFIAATAAAALSQVVLSSLLDDADYLTLFAADAAQIRLGAVLDFVTAGAVVAIAVMFYRVLSRHSEFVSVGYLSARILEAAVIVFGAVNLLVLLAVSKDFVATAPTDSASFETTGSMLLSARELSDGAGTQFIFAATAFILYYSLYRSRIVPRFISVWGFLGAPLMMMSGLLVLFGQDPLSTASVLLAAPLAVNEMVLAVWLIVKGFDSVDIDLSETRTQEERSAELAASTR